MNERQRIAAHIAQLVTKRMCEDRGASTYGCRFRNPTRITDVTVSGEHLKTLVNSAAYDAVMEYLRNRA